MLCPGESGSFSFKNISIFLYTPYRSYSTLNELSKPGFVNMLAPNKNSMCTFQLWRCQKDPIWWNQSDWYRIPWREQLEFGDTQHRWKGLLVNCPLMGDGEVRGIGWGVVMWWGLNSIIPPTNQWWARLGFGNRDRIETFRIIIPFLRLGSRL